MAKRDTAKRNTAQRVRTLDTDRIISPQELFGKNGKVPIDRSTAYRQVKAGTFPAPIRLTSTRLGWWLSDVLQWLEERETGHFEGRTRYGRDKDKPTEAA